VTAIAVPAAAHAPRTTPFDRASRSVLLDRLVKERILVLDGAMGTMIQRYELSEADFRGERFRDHPRDLRGDNDLLNLTSPDIVAAILDDTLPNHITLFDLAVDPPALWDEQRGKLV